MKKILLSLSMIAVVAIAVAGATGAFFSDTETSTGNTFTAGAIDLKVDSEQHYNGNECVNNVWQGNSSYPTGVCDGSWSATDLGAQKFFSFTDVKPGDEGENTISLHVDNNDAWACVDVNVTKNDDVSSTEPELEVDVADITGDLLDGELAQNIYFTAWADTDGDNIWDGQAIEPLLFSNKSGPASDVLGGKTYALADSTTGGVPLTGADTKYIGLAWCAGTQSVDTTTNVIACDGSTMDNKTQTDSMEASVAFRVVQSRNNEGFVCGQSQPTEQETFTLSLQNKNANWQEITNDGMYGSLTYKKSNPTFDYSLSVNGLNPTTSYILLYYADPWPSVNGMQIGNAFTTDVSGNASVLGNVNLGKDLPVPADANSPTGAKLWVIPASQWNGTQMTAWTPLEYLHEHELITYDDSNNI